MNANLGFWGSGVQKGTVRNGLAGLSSSHTPVVAAAVTTSVCSLVPLYQPPSTQSMLKQYMLHLQACSLLQQTRLMISWCMLCKTCCPGKLGPRPPRSC